MVYIFYLPPRDRKLLLYSVLLILLKLLKCAVLCWGRSSTRSGFWIPAICYEPLVPYCTSLNTSSFSLSVANLTFSCEFGNQNLSSVFATGTMPQSSDCRGRGSALEKFNAGMICMRPLASQSALVLHRQRTALRHPHIVQDHLD